jgi:hypothetical protein
MSRPSARQWLVLVLVLLLLITLIFGLILLFQPVQTSVETNWSGLIKVGAANV